MRTVKRLLALSIVFILGFSVAAFGKITYKDITIELRNIQININGKEAKTELEPFIYEDETWVPVRFITEKLGKYVEWDDETNTLAIWDQKPEDGNPPGEKDKNEVTVYITETGKKYHRDGCSYLKKSKIEISLKDAKAQGYTPCSRCKPPK